MPTGSKLTATFMLSVVPGPKASTSRTVSIVERQLWTFTLKRNGPFGDEHVPDTYARLPRTTMASSRLGNAPVTLSNTTVRGSRASVFPSDRNASPTLGSGFRITVLIT